MFVWTPDMIRFMQAANEKSDYHARLAAAARSATRGAGWERYPPR